MFSKPTALTSFVFRTIHTHIFFSWSIYHHRTLLAALSMRDLHLFLPAFFFFFFGLPFPSPSTLICRSTGKTFPFRQVMDTDLPLHDKKPESNAAADFSLSRTAGWSITVCTECLKHKAAVLFFVGGGDSEAHVEKQLFKRSQRNPSGGLSANPTLGERGGGC